MNDAEANLWEVFLGYVEVINTTQSVLITVIFSFLIAVYLAGAKLTRTQLVIIVGVYSLFFLTSITSFSSQILRAIEFAREIEQANPVRHIALNSFTRSLLVSVFLIFYVGSLVFMIQIRRNAKKQLDQA